LLPRSNMANITEQLKHFRVLWRHEVAAVVPGIEDVLAPALERAIQACWGAGGALPASPALRFKHVGAHEPRLFCADPPRRLAVRQAPACHLCMLIAGRPPRVAPPPPPRAGVRLPGLHRPRLLPVQEQQQEALRGD